MFFLEFQFCSLRLRCTQRHPKKKQKALSGAKRRPSGVARIERSPGCCRPPPSEADAKPCRANPTRARAEKGEKGRDGHKGLASVIVVFFLGKTFMLKTNHPCWVSLQENLKQDTTVFGCLLVCCFCCVFFFFLWGGGEGSLASVSPQGLESTSSTSQKTALK